MGITIDRSAVAKLETGRRPVSDIEVAAIARTLKVAIPLLFEGSSDFFESVSDQENTPSHLGT